VLVVADCNGLIRSPFKELLPQLPEAFVRFTEASWSTPLRHAVNRVDDNAELELKDGSTRLRVSESNRHLFKAK